MMDELSILNKLINRAFEELEQNTGNITLNIYRPDGRKEQEVIKGAKLTRNQESLS